MPLVCNQVTESTDSGPEVKCPDVGVGQDVQTEATEPTEEYLKQSTGPSLNYAIIL